MQTSIVSVQINQWPATATSKHDEQVLLSKLCGFSPSDPYLCGKFQNRMTIGCVKCLLVLIFSLLFSVLFTYGQHGDGEKGQEKKKSFDANEVIFGHVLDGHEFHFFSYKDGDGKEHAAVIPLPVILYSPQRGFSTFMSSKFHHGEENHNGYSLLTDEKNS
jgi:F-type H+-transporting ATPase subunit a